MIEMPGVVGDVMRSVGLSTAMKAAGVVTGLLPIPQPTLLVGPGSSRRLGEAIAGFGHRKVLLVTDRMIAGLGLTNALVAALTERGTEHVLFDGAVADAPIPSIDLGIKLYTAQGCDAIVAFGGGSPMDTAKTIALAVANDKPPAKLVGYFKGMRAPVPLYAVPTTAGTGSEVTVAAVISDPRKHSKLVIADTRIVPAMAALDPLLMTGLPPAVTAATGIDALTHAVEAYIGNWATAGSDRMALAAVAMIYRWLPTAYRDGQNLEAREQMSLAATYAGLAFTRANVGYVHAIAHQLGAKYGTPHGLANAIVLPHVLEFVAPAATERLARLSEAAALPGKRTRPVTRAKKFVASVVALNRELGIPDTLEALRERDIRALAKAACWEADTSYPVPRYMSPDDCAHLLRRILPTAASVRASGRQARAKPRD